MRSLTIKSLIAAIVAPGMVTGLIPILILKDKIHKPWPIAIHHILGTIVFLTGLMILIHCIKKFTIEGKGTLLPVSPTKHLVVTGLYKYSRNPMYVGVMTILLGEVVFSLSKDLVIYAIIVFLAFNTFIFIIEEPRLKRDFDQEYRDYCKKVRRWI